MSKYIALQPILYAGRQHKPGETVDCDDFALAQLWIENGAVRGSARTEVDLVEVDGNDLEDVEPETQDQELPAGGQSDKNDKPRLGRTRAKKE